jgi:hypothetical protein
MTNVMIESTRAMSGPLNRSRTTARAITGPAAPPSACRKRSAINTSMRGASAQPSDESTYSATPHISGLRRP